MAVIDFNNLNNNHGYVTMPSCLPVYRQPNINYNQIIPMQSSSSSTYYNVNNNHGTVYQGGYMMEPPRQFRQQVDIQTGMLRTYDTFNKPKEVYKGSNANVTPSTQLKGSHKTALNSFNFDSISIKSKIGVEFRRYSLSKDVFKSFDSFYRKIESFHHLSSTPFVMFYTDTDDFPLPINNDDNLAKAIRSTISLFSNHQGRSNTSQNSNKIPFLKIYIEKKGTVMDYSNYNRYKKSQHFKGLSNKILSHRQEQSQKPSISMPENFRQVSSIIDADIVPDTCRRVRIVKHGTDRPLGFYIRDGTQWRMNHRGQFELVTGVFISRLVPGGLAESTGLLAVNDEVLEVNGIQVTNGKTLDQVTDLMVANSSNLIITIRPGKINFLSLV